MLVSLKMGKEVTEYINEGIKQQNQEITLCMESKGNGEHICLSNLDIEIYRSYVVQAQKWKYD
jgi:hypothetical protein